MKEESKEEVMLRKIKATEELESRGYKKETCKKCDGKGSISPPYPCIGCGGKGYKWIAPLKR